MMMMADLFENTSRTIVECIQTATTAIESTTNLISEVLKTRRNIPKEAWRAAVIAELDYLEINHPESYARIPAFLQADPGSINGHSYCSCFYGHIARGPLSADMLASYARVAVPNPDTASVGLSTIETIVIMLYPFVQQVGAEVNRKMFMGWIEEHFAKHSATAQEIPSGESVQVEAISQEVHIQVMFQNMRGIFEEVSTIINRLDTVDYAPEMHFPRQEAQHIPLRPAPALEPIRESIRELCPV